MAEADLRAQQQRHPRYFRNARDYLNKLEASEADKVQQFDLTEELEAARNVVSTIRTRVLEYEQTGADVLKETTALLNELVQAVKNGEWLEAGEKDRLIEAAETMVKKITCPLTERGSGGPVEMCDSTRYKLQLEAAKQLTEIAENVQKLQAITMITRESFVDWLKRFYRELKKEFGVMTYTRKEGTFLITEGVGEAMKNAGDPRRGL